MIDADHLARQAIDKGQAPYLQVVNWLGDGVLQTDGHINRAQLGEKVFANPEFRLKLEQIIHPWVQAKVTKEKKQLESKGCPLAVYDVPLLFERNLESMFDQTLLIACSEELQRQRLRERNNWSEAHIQDRLSSQLPLSEKRARATHVIENEGTREELKSALQVWLRQAIC